MANEIDQKKQNKNDESTGTRDGFGLGTERTLEGFQRYRMIGSDDEGKLFWNLNSEKNC